MKPTRQLIKEHDSIKEMLKVIEKVSQKLEAGEEVNPDHLDSIINFIRIFADKCHHGKEEDLLFSAMEEVGISKESGPIGVMLSEHELGRKYVKGMDDGVVSYKKGEIKAALQIAENARKYATLLTQHIYKEDNILYPMADMHLSEEKQQELIKEFEKVEQEKIGIGKHQELLNTLNYLSDIYLI
jgi:hemerythrin-like domain-containing protein